MIQKVDYRREQVNPRLYFVFQDAVQQHLQRMGKVDERRVIRGESERRSDPPPGEMVAEKRRQKEVRSSRYLEQREREGTRGRFVIHANDDALVHEDR